ncbi:hypothetical protein N7504_001143 [Penicillium tannophilum]|nr:hypothetical protein N7504_001143 [Penicillium tannophilum]
MPLIVISVLHPGITQQTLKINSLGDRAGVDRGILVLGGYQRLFSSGISCLVSYMFNTNAGAAAEVTAVPVDHWRRCLGQGIRDWFPGRSKSLWVAQADQLLKIAAASSSD